MTSNRTFGLTAALVAGFLWCAFPAAAQQPGGTLYGIVSDPQNRPVSGARVKAVNAKTGAAAEAAASTFGIYILSGLEPGIYTVSTEPPGFRKAETADVHLADGARLSLDFKLHPVAEAPAPPTAPAPPKPTVDAPSRLAQAENLLRQRKFDEAAQVAGEVLRADPANETAALRKATALAAMRKISEARQTLEALVAARPEAPEAWLQLANIRLAEKNIDGAEEAYRKSRDLRPKDDRPLIGLAEVEMARNRPDAAMGLLEDELKKAPGRVALRLTLGNLAIRAGDIDRGLAEFRRVLPALDPKSAGAAELHTGIGEALRRKGDVAGAIDEFQKALAIAPRSPRALTALALTYDGAGRRAEALARYREVLAQEPRNPLVLNNVAYMLADTGGNLDEALALAERAVELAPGAREIRDTLGWVHFKRREYDQAEKAFREALATAPDSASTLYHLGLTLWEKGNREEARKQFQQALQHSPRKEEAAEIQKLLAQP